AAKAKAEADAKVAADTKAKADAEARAKAEADAAAKKKADEAAAAKLKADTDAKAAADAAAKKKADEEAAAKAKADGDSKAMAELAAKKKLADEAAAKAAADAKAKADADLAAKKKADEAAAAKIAADAKSNEENKGKAKSTVRQTLGGNETQYGAAMVRGTNNMKYKQYPEAVAAYTEALTYKPNDALATTKLAEAKKNIPGEVVLVKKEPNPLCSKYPQGKTQTDVTDKTGTRTTIILVKGEEAWTYTKTTFSFGTRVFQKDGVTITENQYEYETR
ncbi:MAG: hypothetical protein ABI448_15885, partial [Bacteroidia bacterium]